MIERFRSRGECLNPDWLPSPSTYIHPPLPLPPSGLAASAPAWSKIKLKMMLTLSVRSSLGMMLFMSAADTYKGQEVQERKGVIILYFCKYNLILSSLDYISTQGDPEVSSKTKQQNRRGSSLMWLCKIYWFVGVFLLLFACFLFCSCGEGSGKDTYFCSDSQMLRFSEVYQLKVELSDLTTEKKYTCQGSKSPQIPGVEKDKGIFWTQNWAINEVYGYANITFISFCPEGIIKRRAHSYLKEFLTYLSERIPMFFRRM